MFLMHLVCHCELVQHSRIAVQADILLLATHHASCSMSLRMVCPGIICASFCSIASLLPLGPVCLKHISRKRTNSRCWSLVQPPVISSHGR